MILVLSRSLISIQTMQGLADLYLHWYFLSSASVYLLHQPHTSQVHQHHKSVWLYHMKGCNLAGGSNCNDRLPVLTGVWCSSIFCGGWPQVSCNIIPWAVCMEPVVYSVAVFLSQLSQSEWKTADSWGFLLISEDMLKIFQSGNAARRSDNHVCLRDFVMN